MGFTLTRYVALSVLAASAVVYHAFATRQYFYRSTIYLSSSKIAVAAMGNLAFALALCTHQLVIKLFLGSLRDIEQEMIRERLSSAVMESLLALTIFREEFSAFFVAMFASLVFIKVMHWLVQDRVDYVEVTPTISLLGHARIVSFMALLLALDAAFLQYTIAGTIQSSGQSVMLLFAFEYVILASTIVRYGLKYGMSMADLAMDGNWTGKGTAVFYLELIADLLHLFVYSTFFAIVFMHYGLPLHLVRDLYSTFRNFRSRMHDFLRFRQVTARLDRFPDASAEDLRRCDGVCIICREEMVEAGANKRLHCGHVFHLHCLRSWLERQQNCPTCRASVFRRPPPAAPAVAAAAAPAGAAADVAADGGGPAHRPAAAHHHGDGAAADPAVPVHRPAEPHAAAAAGGAELRHRVHVPSDAMRAAMAATAAAAPPRGANTRPPGLGAAAGGAAAAASGGAAAAPAGTTPAVGASGLPPHLEATLRELLQAHRTQERRLAELQHTHPRAPLATLTAGELATVRNRIRQLEATLAGGGAAAGAAPAAAAASSSPYPTIPPPFAAPTPAAASATAAAGGAAGAAPGGGGGGGGGAAYPPMWSAPMVPPQHIMGVMGMGMGGMGPGMPGFGFGMHPAFMTGGMGMGMPPMMPNPFMMGPQHNGMFGMLPVPVPMPNGAATPAAAAGVAPGAPAAAAVAGVQVPLHLHQLAAAAAAAAASAAAAAMFGGGMFPNGGGMVFVPQAVAAAAAAAGGNPAAAPSPAAAAATAGPSSSAAAAPAEAAASSTSAVPTSSPTDDDASAEAPSTSSAATPAAAVVDGGSSAASAATEEAAPAAEPQREVAPCGEGSSAAAKATEGEGAEAEAAGALQEQADGSVAAAVAPEEDAAAEEVRRLRLQRFGAL